MDLLPSIYHEKQEAGSMLCAQHALNNLLQNALFTPQDLAFIAQQLDALEASHMDPTAVVRESENYDDSGFFSVMVLEEALKVLGLRLVRWSNPELAAVHHKPEVMEAFVLNHQLHWFTVRRFAVPERFYNLDSCKDTPEWISPTFLGMTLASAEAQGYSIFVVVPLADAQITSLPPCTASDAAATLPPPSSSRTSAGPSSVGPNPFSGQGHKLGGRTRSKRPALEEDKDDDDDGLEGMSPEAESGERSKGRRKVMLERDYDTEDDGGMARAVEESLSIGSGASRGGSTATGRGRGDDEEAEMLRRAMEESLKESGAGNQAEEEDDNPSLEEMRKRRLARFGG